MSLTRRLASLNLVHRVNTHALEAIGADLAAVRARQATLTFEQDALKAQAQFEAAHTTPESYAFLSSYLISVEQRQQQLTEQSEVLEEQAELLEEQLLTAFQQVKTNEAVKGKTVQEIREGLERKEMQAMDDASRALFLLKQANRL